MILLVGAGPMAQEYARILLSIKKEFTVLGRGEKSAKVFEEATGKSVILKSLDSYLEKNSASILSAIVSVGVEQLGTVTRKLLAFEIKNILVEKPAGLNFSEISEVNKIAKLKNANVSVAYNRRFLSSVLSAEKIIKADGGVTSFTFEVTEWAHTIAPLKKGPGVKAAWFLGNTSHVADLAFHLGGLPRELHPQISGGSEWHPSGMIFTGSGVSVKDALFSYHGNWAGPGRWALEFLTKNNRFIFKPLEKLQIQKIGSVRVEEFPVDDSLDTSFKPGLYLQVQDFLDGGSDKLCSLEEHLAACEFYVAMAGY